MTPEHTIVEDELILQIESWKNSRDGVLAHIAQIECEKLRLEHENTKLRGALIRIRDNPALDPEGNAEIAGEALSEVKE